MGWRGIAYLVLALLASSTALAAAPVINLTITTTNTSYVYLNVTADQAVSTWWYSVDGGANVTFTPNTTIVGLGNGVHTITVYARNSLGEVGNSDNRVQPAVLANWTIDNGNTDYGYDIEVVDGGYLLYGSKDFYAWIVRTDENGNHLWNRTYGTNDEYVWDLLVEDDGYTMIMGTGSYGAGSYDFWLLKTDLNGTVVINQTYGGPGSDIGYFIRELADGYLLGGATTSFGVGVRDYWLLKVNETGGHIWNQTYGGPDFEEVWNLHTLDGSYFFLGYTNSTGAGLADMDIRKISTNGTLLWNKTWGSTNNDEARFMVNTSDGYLLCGDGNISGSFDTVLIKMNKTGDVLWNKTYGGAQYDNCNEMIENDGTYILVGYTYSSGAGGSDAWLIGVDAQGNQLWNLTVGAAQHEVVWRTAPKGQGDVLFGYSNSYSATYDFYFIEIGSDRQAQNFTVNDTSAPVITMTSPVEGVTYANQNVPLRVSANEAIARWQYSADGKENVTFTPNSSILLDNGAHTLTVYATDYAGNVGTTDYDDNLPPENLWSLELDSGGSDSGTAIFPANEGGHIFTATMSDDARLFKIDELGTVVWNRTYGGNESDTFEGGIAVSDGYVIVGSYMSGGVRDMWILKVNNRGGVGWETFFGGSADDYASDVIAVNDGLIVTGFGSSFGPGDRFMVVKLDFNGNYVWNATFDSGSFDFCNSKAIELADGYLISGSTNPGDYDIWLIKINTTGGHQWNKTFDSGVNDFYSGNPQVMPDNGYLLSTYDFGGNINLFKFNTTGDYQWNKTYSGVGAGGGAYGVYEWGDNYVIQGYTTTAGAGGHDVWLVKINESGEEIWNGTWGTTGQEQLNPVGYSDGRAFYSAGFTGEFADQNVTIGKFVDDGPLHFSVAEQQGSSWSETSEPEAVPEPQEPAPVLAPEPTVETGYEEGTTLDAGDEQVTILEVKEDKVVVDIGETQYTIPENTFVEIDVDEDGINDIRINTGSITNGKAEITITELEQPVAAAAEEEIEEPEAVEVREPQDMPAPEAQEAQLVASQESKAVLWLVIFAVAIIAVMGYFAVRAHKF